MLGLPMTCVGQMMAPAASRGTALLLENHPAVCGLVLGPQDEMGLDHVVIQWKPSLLRGLHPQASHMEAIGEMGFPHRNVLPWDSLWSSLDGCVRLDQLGWVRRFRPSRGPVERTVQPVSGSLVMSGGPYGRWVMQCHVRFFYTCYILLVLKSENKVIFPTRIYCC